MFLTLMRPSLVLFLVLWLKLVKDFLKVRCRLALLPFLISCLIWLDLVASLPLIKRIFLMSSLMLLLVWLIFFMVLIKLLAILGTISGKTVKLMVLALICLGNNRQD